MAQVLIAGCGYVGNALALRLTSMGHTVHGLRRDVTRLPAGVRPLAADLADPRTLGKLPSGLRYVVYAAAPDGSSEEAYKSIYVDGLRNLLHALHEPDKTPERVLLTSSTVVFAQQAGEWVDETSPSEPESYRGRIVLEGERTLLASPFTATVLRLGGIYGPDRTRLIEQVRRGEARIEAKAPFTNRIHRDDAAGALAHLLFLPDAERLYIGVDHEPARRADVIRWLAERTGTSIPEIAPADPLGASAGKRCRNEALVQSGYVFRYPTFRDGYAAVLAAME